MHGKSHIQKPEDFWPLSNPVMPDRGVRTGLANKGAEMGCVNSSNPAWNMHRRGIRLRLRNKSKCVDTLESSLRVGRASHPLTSKDHGIYDVALFPSLF